MQALRNAHLVWEIFSQATIALRGISRRLIYYDPPVSVHTGKASGTPSATFDYLRIKLDAQRYKALPTVDRF